MKKLIILTIILLTTNMGRAQEINLSGKVTDESGPLPGVSIIVKGTQHGTQTNFDGEYQLKALIGDVLIYSFIGMKTEERIVGRKSIINVQMSGDNVLDEVVVTAYGISRKSRSLGYSVQTLNYDQGNNINNALAGKVAGVQIAGSKRNRRKNRRKYKNEYKVSVNDESYAKINENRFLIPSNKALSTFSIDVDKAGYSNLRRLINNGEEVPTGAVKVEEMINYFDYDYKQPTDVHPFSIRTDLASTPWNAETKLVRIGLQGKTYLNEDLPASNLTFLIDVSGSMSNYNKLPLLKKAFKLLVSHLREKDMVSIVVYAGAAGVVLKPTRGDQKEKILSALDNLYAGGSTAGGAGIKLAYDLAIENFKKFGNNRVVLATDGDFNVGLSSDDAMEKLIEEKRNTGVYLSVLGFGMGNYKDSKLEKLADKGNGNHAYIDNIQEAQKVFGKEFGGTLYTIAKDVKIQVEFNPTKVQAYRLIGYENRLLADEDFSDDTKDAGELGSGHTVTALYEIIPIGIDSKYMKDVIKLKYRKKVESSGFNDELLTVKFRYKRPSSKKSVEMVHVLKDEVTDMTKDFKFAAAVALFGMQLKESQYINDTNARHVINLAESGRGSDKQGYRAEFIRLVKATSSIK